MDLGVGLEALCTVERERTRDQSDEDIRDRLKNALCLVDEIVAERESRRLEQPVTESYVKAILALRRKRELYFDRGLFADPAWDILLELYAAELGQRRLSVSSLCIGAAVPATTALRWIGALEKKGLIERSDDPLDARRIFVALSTEGIEKLERFFSQAPAEMFIV